uniref:26S proteasome non-ATPase regulatory subunit RPN1 C-terminal domain-containing protein n=1 Tax=Glycine max TaxID=3847 RepID=A0A0R0JZ49_SOYBN
MDSVEATAEVSKTFNEKIRKYCDMTLLSCGYAGTENVLKVQNLLGHCSQHLDKGENHQGSAVLEIAMVAMAEELGLEMTIRSLEHLLQYGEQNICQAVPLALGLLCISNPKVNVMDTLSRLSHDTKLEVATVRCGCYLLGSNRCWNKKCLNCWHASQSFKLLLQGYQPSILCKLSLSFPPYFLISTIFMVTYFLLPYLLVRTVQAFPTELTRLARLITMLHACLDMKAIVLGKFHYVLYLFPRMLLTMDENLKPLSVPARTHSTPVLLATGDKAELATEKYIPLSPILEGFIILKENPDYRQE